MAQTGFTPISNYYSATATNVPTAGNLVAGELAINTADGKLFYKDSAGVVQTLATKATTAGTYSSITTNNLTIGTTGIGQGNASIMKNRIINGAMVIDQRNAGASGTATSYTVDRWSYNATQASKGTWQQNAGSVTPPVGFKNYLGFTSSSNYAVAAGDYFAFQQVIEGYNIADLGWGTANAKTVTLSFWVYSSLTGTFGGAFQNSGLGQSYPFTYSIPVANTWTQISITIAGSTSSTWLSTNGAGLYVVLSLGAGSTYSGTAGAWTATPAFTATGATSVVGTNGATFYITGVQLEVGSSATGFEYRQYGQELALCQRYYSVINDAYIRGYGLSACSQTITLPTTMRTSATLTKVGTWLVLNSGQPVVGSSVTTSNYTSFYLQIVPTITGDCYAQTSSTATYITASAEL